MVEKNKQVPGTLDRIKQTFRKHGSITSDGGELISESPPRRGGEVHRSSTISGPIAPRRRSKRSSQTDETLLSPNRRATFYEYGDVTWPVSHPADFTPLDLQGKRMDQVLKLLKPVSYLITKKWWVRCTTYIPVKTTSQKAV